MALTNKDWQPFGLTDEDYGPADRRGMRIVNLAWRAPAGKDRAAVWLRNAMIALAVLAAAAAVVSFQAQYRMVQTAKHTVVVAALEAGIPDVSALIFASLGIALALHGKRAVRARILNVGAVVTSIGMNALAAGPGWRNAAIWIMPPVAYALASDTAIGVVRSYTLARQRALSEGLATDEASPLALLGGALLWLLRLVMAPPSTLSGLRKWVIEDCPVAPGQAAAAVAAAREPDGARLVLEPQPVAAVRPGGGGYRDGTKTARFIALVTERHGPLAGLRLEDVSKIAAEVAPEVDLHTGSARAALRAQVLQAQQAGGES